MRTFLACSHVDGRPEAVEVLRGLAEERRPDAILFAGGLFAPVPGKESLAAAAQRRHEDVQLLEKFLAALGELKSAAALIPGPTDSPLRTLLMAGMHARSQWPGVHLVHCTMITARDVVISGVGGELTHAEDSGDPVVRCSRTVSEYFLQSFGFADESERILLLGCVPQGQLGGTAGNPIAGELIDSYHPRLCVVAGPDQHRGLERFARTSVVSPGHLSQGHAAWIDWSRDVDDQVQML